MAPPENGDEGSTASTPTRPPSGRGRRRSDRSVSVDLPGARRPGDPDDVLDRRHSAAKVSRPTWRAGSPPRSTRESKPAEAPLSPAWAASRRAAGSRCLADAAEQLGSRGDIGDPVSPRGGRGTLGRSVVGAGRPAPGRSDSSTRRPGRLAAGPPPRTPPWTAVASKHLGSKRCETTWTPTRWWS